MYSQTTVKIEIEEDAKTLEDLKELCKISIFTLYLDFLIYYNYN